MSEQFSDDNSHKIPDPAQLEELLSQIKPVPSVRFEKRMTDAPWFQESPKGRIIADHRRVRSLQIIYGSIFLLLVILSSGVLFVPSIRVVARQIIYSFIFSKSNQIEVQVTLENPGDLYKFSDPGNFSKTIQEAQGLAGFPLKTPSKLFNDLQLVGARYDASYSAATILYQAEKLKLFLTQRELNSGEDVFSIGPDARIQLVDLKNTQGEYVLGGWKTIPSEESSSSSGQSTITAVWDNNLPQSTLRWQEKGISFELRVLGENRPSLSDLISISNGLK